MTETETETELSLVDSDYTEGYYEEGYDDDPWSSGYLAGYGDITTLVEGDLADRVRKRSGLVGDVLIVEHHWDSGYCVTCSYEEIDFLVKVGETQVYTADKYDVDSPMSLVGFAGFNEWLNEEVTNE